MTQKEHIESSIAMQIGSLEKLCKRIGYIGDELKQRWPEPRTVREGEILEMVSSLVRDTEKIMSLEYGIAREVSQLVIPGVRRVE